MSRRVPVVAALVAGALWIASGVLNSVLHWQGPRVPYQVINVLVPAALDFSLRPGEYQVSVMAAVGAVVLALVVGGVTLLAVRDLPAGRGRMTLFLAVWFAAVAGSTVAATVQVLRVFVRDLMSAPATINGLLPYVTGGGYWGIALGWLVGLAAVLAGRAAARPAR